MAATLEAAAATAFDNCYPRWLADTLKTNLGTFWQACSVLFDEQNPNDQPVGNWVAIIADLATTMQPNHNSLGAFFDLNAASQLIYRICWLTSYLWTRTLITNVQQQGVLAAYNASIE